MQPTKKLDMTPDEEEKLHRAEELVMTYMPHFRHLLTVAKKAGITITDTPDLDTAGTYPNGRIEFSRNFLAKLKPDEVAFILAHELGHHYLDTFGRSGRGDGTHGFQQRVNTASDTLINHMVNRHFMAAGLPDFSKPTSKMYNGMWWQADRLYCNGFIVPPDEPQEDGSPKTCDEEFKPVAEALKEQALRLPDALRKADMRWFNAEDGTMEAVLRALTTLESFRKNTQMLKLLSWSLAGEVRLEAPDSAPMPWPVILDFPNIQAQEDKITFTCSQKADWDDAPAGTVTTGFRITLKLLSELDHSTQAHTFHLQLIPKDQDIPKLRKGLTVRFQTTPDWQELGFEADIELARDNTNELTLRGTVTWTPKESPSQGITGGNGQGGNRGRSIGIGGNPSYTGDCRSLDELREKYPELTNQDIEDARRELKEARGYAARNVLAPTKLDLEVRKDCYRVPWENLLQKWFDDNFLTKRDWNRASRRGQPEGDICLPGRSRYGFILNIVLDTSGSMSPKRLGKALGAISQFCSQNCIDSVRILECDAQLQDIKTVTADELSHYTAKGGGGTDMTPALERFAQEPGVSGVVVLTDGYFEPPREIPPYHVLWGIVGHNPDASFPFGTVMPIES